MVLLGLLVTIGLSRILPQVVTPAGFAGLEPQIASSGTNAYIACGSGDQLYVIRSEDAGKSFGRPIWLATTGHLALGMRRGPRIAASGALLVVTAIYGRQGDGKDGDVLAWRSKDAGKSWEGPSMVSDVPGSASEGLDAVAASTDGKFASVWLDHRAGSAEVWASTSRDGGESWSKNIRVYRSPDGHVCECCHPSVAFGPKGELDVMFRNWLGGSRYMYLAVAPTGADKFQPAIKLGEGTWPLNACPMDGGNLAVRPVGTIFTAWRRNESVFMNTPGQAEIEVGKGIQPWLAVHDSEGCLVWQQQGSIVSEGLHSPVKVLGTGRDPVIAYVGGRFLAAWADEAGRIRLENAN